MEYVSRAPLNIPRNWSSHNIPVYINRKYLIFRRYVRAVA